MDKNRKYPEGHFIGMWMGIGIALFSGLGIPLSIATKNPGLMGIGPAIGVAFGLSVGAGIEERYKKQGKIRPLTRKEKKIKKLGVLAGLVMLVLGIAAAFLFMYLR
ncbi:hypothetical protein KY366_01925 [Candidatus Woesearchaeota archaeon]|nr:hypothetical protein [Candidatus Woesearchaeota archaeon]